MGFVTKQQRATFICLGLGQGCIADCPLKDTAFTLPSRALGLTRTWGAWVDSLILMYLSSIHGGWGWRAGAFPPPPFP